MNVKNRILSFIDFSGNAETVMQFTRYYRNHLNAEAVLIHQVPGIFPPRASAVIRGQFINAEKVSARHKLEEMTTSFFSEPPLIVTSEKSIKIILSDFEDAGYNNWVFIGLKETGLMKKIFIGTKAIEIIDNSPFVIMALPVNVNYDLPKHLIIGAHYQFPLKENLLHQLLKNLAGSVEKITFISVVTEDINAGEMENYLGHLSNNFQKYNAGRKIFYANDVSQELNNYMLKNRDAFLAVQQGSRSLKDHLFRKYLINELVYTGQTPLIVLPNV